MTTAEVKACGVTICTASYSSVPILSPCDMVFLTAGLSGVRSKLVTSFQNFQWLCSERMRHYKVRLIHNSQLLVWCALILIGKVSEVFVNKVEP